MTDIATYFANEIFKYGCDLNRMLAEQVRGDDMDTIIPVEDTLESAEAVRDYLEMQAKDAQGDYKAAKSNGAAPERIAALRATADLAALNYARAARVVNAVRNGG